MHSRDFELICMKITVKYRVELHYCSLFVHICSLLNNGDEQDGIYQVKVYHLVDLT